MGFFLATWDRLYLQLLHSELSLRNLVLYNATLCKGLGGNEGSLSLLPVGIDAPEKS